MNSNLAGLDIAKSIFHLYSLSTDGNHLVKEFEQGESREHNQETFKLRMPLRGG